MTTCRTSGCNRAAIPEWNYCADCKQRVIDNALYGPAVAPAEPEWVRRMRVNGLPAKDYTTVAA